MEIETAQSAEVQRYTKLEEEFLHTTSVPPTRTAYTRRDVEVAPLVSRQKRRASREPRKMT